MKKKLSVLKQVSNLTWKSGIQNYRQKSWNLTNFENKLEKHEIFNNFNMFNSKILI